MELHLAADSPPLAAIAAAKTASLPLTTTRTLASGSPPSLLLSNGEKLHEDCVLLKYIGRIAANLPNFYGGDAYQSCKIDEWIDYAPVFSSESEFDGACSFVDAHLLHSTFIVGASLSIADVAVWARLAGAGLRWESLRKSKKCQNLVRWFNSILSEHDAALNDFVATYTGNKSSSTKAVSSKSKESQASNARSAATEKGSHMVEKAGSRPRFEVDHFPKFMEMAEKLIREGKAYVDDTPCEKMHQERLTECIKESNKMIARAVDEYKIVLQKNLDNLSKMCHSPVVTTGPDWVSDTFSFEFVNGDEDDIFRNGIISWDKSFSEAQKHNPKEVSFLKMKGKVFRNNVYGCEIPILGHIASRDGKNFMVITERITSTVSHFFKHETCYDDDGVLEPQALNVLRSILSCLEDMVRCSHEGIVDPNMMFIINGHVLFQELKPWTKLSSHIMLPQIQKMFKKLLFEYNDVRCRANPTGAVTLVSTAELDDFCTLDFDRYTSPNCRLHPFLLTMIQKYDFPAWVYYRGKINSTNRTYNQYVSRCPWETTFRKCNWRKNARNHWLLQLIYNPRLVDPAATVATVYTNQPHCQLYFLRNLISHITDSKLVGHIQQSGETLPNADKLVRFLYENLGEVYLLIIYYGAKAWQLKLF